MMTAKKPPVPLEDEMQDGPSPSFITLTFSLPLYFLNSAHLDSPCSSDKFPCHTGLAQLILVSSFMIILKFFTACKKKLEVCNFVPTCWWSLDEENPFFEFFYSKSHHPSLMYFNTQKFSQVVKGKLYFVFNFISNWAETKSSNFFHKPGRKHFIFSYFLVFVLCQ